MTFEEFQLTRTFVDDLSVTPLGSANDDLHGSGVVYARGAVYIEDHGPVDESVQGRYFLVIERSDYSSNSLTELEGVLFAWFESSMGRRPSERVRPNLHKLAAEAHALAIAFYDRGGEMLDAEIEERVSAHASALSEHCGVDLDEWQRYFVTGAKATQRECHEMFRKIHTACLRGFHIPRVQSDGDLQFIPVECPDCDHEFDSLIHFGQCPNCGCTG